MLVIIDWDTFALKYLNQNTIYVKEDDTAWYVYTQDGRFYIKATVPKDVNMEKNMMFVERYFNGRTNVVKVMDIIEGYKEEEEEEERPEEPEEDYYDGDYEVEDE